MLSSWHGGAVLEGVLYSDRLWGALVLHRAGILQPKKKCLMPNLAETVLRHGGSGQECSLNLKPYMYIAYCITERIF